MSGRSAPAARGSVVGALLRPRALVSHAIVLGVVAVLVALGQWQIARLGEVRTINRLLAERLAAAPADLADLLAAGVPADELEFRRVEVTGTFRPDEEVLQRNRVNGGLTGLDVLTPLDLGDGRTLLVRRGWVPPDLDEPPVAAAPPPSGRVRVAGVLEATVDQPTFGARDPDDGVLARVFHPDTARLDRQMTGDLLPVVLRLTAPVPATADALPRPPDAPDLDEGSHLSYAVQWHLFAVLALAAYAAWWWRRLRPVAGPEPRVQPRT